MLLYKVFSQVHTVMESQRKAVIIAMSFGHDLRRLYVECMHNGPHPPLIRKPLEESGGISKPSSEIMEIFFRVRALHNHAARTEIKGRGCVKKTHGSTSSSSQLRAALREREIRFVCMTRLLSQHVVPRFASVSCDELPSHPKKEPLSQSSRPLHTLILLILSSL